MTAQLTTRPYEHDSLEPHMSEQALRYHYGKHHPSYVDKLNAAIEGTDLTQSALETFILKSADDEAKVGLFNNAAQV